MMFNSSSIKVLKILKLILVFLQVTVLVKSHQNHNVNSPSSSSYYSYNSRTNLNYPNSKLSYLNQELKRFNAEKQHHQNHLRLSPSSSLSSSTATTNHHHRIRHGQHGGQIHTNTNLYRNNPNSRFTKMDQLISKIDDYSSTTGSGNRLDAGLTENPIKNPLIRTTTSRIDLTTPKFSRKLTNNPFRKLYTNSGISRTITTTTTTTTSTTTEKPEDLNSEDYDITEDEDEDIQKPNKVNVIEDEETKATEDRGNQEDDDTRSVSDDDDDEEDEDNDQDDLEDEDEDDLDDWQAEEATEEPTERSFTDYKWKHFGTRSRVEESRRNQGILNNNLRHEVLQAVEHARKINTHGSCKTPHPRVIKVQSVYPDTGKAYIPHCTLLHRCSDDTGCCRSESLTCAPKKTERIDLYFYTGHPGNFNVEKLAFYNHTECHCVDRTSEMMSRDAESSSEDQYPLKPNLDTKSYTPHRNSEPEPIRRCQCPELFTPEINHGHCRCDCQEGHRDCIRIKKGKEYFALKDRICIQKQECGYPACEFGVYIQFSGRCPRKQEKLDAYSRTPYIKP